MKNASLLSAFLFAVAGIAWAQEDGFVPLLNGKDLTGWTYKKSGPFDGKTDASDKRYTAKDGMIVVNDRIPGGSTHAQLWTTKEFGKNCEIRFEFRASKDADSGFFIRGPQLQVRDYVVAGPWKDLKKYKPQDWNEVVIIVKDNVATSTCNGEKLGDPMKLPAKGPMGLEADRGIVEYRKIRIKETD